MSETSSKNAMQDTGRFGSVPQPAFILGFAGLIPFVTLAGAMLIGQADIAAAVRPLLLAYAIAILAFMGAVHWGIAMESGAGRSADSMWRRYGTSVLPALAAAGTPILAPHLQFAWLALCFAALLAYDLVASARSETAAWYPVLRWPLTVVVCICLGAVAAIEI